MALSTSWVCVVKLFFLIGVKLEFFFGLCLMQKSFASSWTMIDGKTNSSHQVSPMTLESNLAISCFWTSSQRVRRLSQLWKLNLTGTSLRRPGRQLWRSFQVREFQATPPKTDMEPEYHLFEKEHHPPSTSILGFHVKKFSWMYSFCRFQFLCLSLQRSSKELLGLLGLQKLPKLFGGSCAEHVFISLLWNLELQPQCILICLELGEQLSTVNIFVHPFSLPKGRRHVSSHRRGFLRRKNKKSTSAWSWSWIGWQFSLMALSTSWVCVVKLLRGWGYLVTCYM